MPDLQNWNNAGRRILADQLLTDADVWRDFELGASGCPKCQHIRWSYAGSVARLVTLAREPRDNTVQATDVKFSNEGVLKTLGVLVRDRHPYH